MKTILGIFSDSSFAKDAITKLEDIGYNPKDISILMKDQTRLRQTGEDTGATAAGGAISGAATGGVIGALAGLLVSTGVIPGLGAFLVGGPLAAALGLTGAAAMTVSGAATGVLAGGIIGALTSLGLSTDEARVYESRINEGGVLVAVPARSGEEDEVKSILEEYGADQVKSIDNTGSTKAMRQDEYTPAYASDVRSGDETDETDD